MVRFVVILLFASVIMLSGTSCSTMRTAEGHRYKPLTKFNFRFNNNQISHAAVYKRYVAYNKKQQSKGKVTNPKQLAKKHVQPKSTTAKKGLLAVH